jgi:hypothetical protein
VASAALRQLVGQTPIDEHLALLLRRLRALLDAAGGQSDAAEEVEMTMHGAARGLCFEPDSPHTDAAQERLWSAPGMAALLLAGDDLRSDSVRAWRAAFPLGQPSAEAIQLLLPAEEAATAAALNAADMKSGWTRPGAYVFCYLYYNVILAAAVASRSSHCSVHDGAGALRSGRLADAAARRALACGSTRACASPAATPWRRRPHSRSLTSPRAAATPGRASWHPGSASPLR